MALSPAQKEYWVTRKKIQKYQTIQFINNKFGTISLVANQFLDKTLDVNGTPTTFQAVRAEIPDQPVQGDGTNNAQILFSRIAVDIRQYLRMIDDYTNMDDAVIQAVIRIYRADQTEPMTTYSLFVDESGVEMDDTDATVTLTQDNPMRARAKLFYDPNGVWTGLQR